MIPGELRDRVAGARVATLSTVDSRGRPHAVPCVLALEGDTVFIPVDAKPKRPGPLQRERNLARSPAATLLIHHYEEDWRRLWWVRLRGRGRVVSSGSEMRRATLALEARYPQYGAMPAIARVIAVDVDDSLGWSAEPAG